MGTRFVSGAAILRLYRRSVGSGIGCDDVTDEQARVFVAGNGPLTRYRANKHTVLAGFYRYAIGRGYAARSPLRALAAYAARRAAYPVPLGKDSAFLANRDGTRLAPRTVHKAFAASGRRSPRRGRRVTTAVPPLLPSCDRRPR